MIRANPLHLDTSRPPVRGGLTLWVRALRPLQWAKNVLVFVAPGAAGVLKYGSGMTHAVEGFALFCAAASGAYLVNDVIDADADRLHPTKRNRPIAAGEISVPVALVTAVVLIAISLEGSWFVAGWRLFVVMAIYQVTTFSYSVWLKSVPVIELMAVASGFLLRGIAGGVATNQPLSRWFLLVTSFAALFLVVGKRLGECERLGDEAGAHRSSLEGYTPQFLRSALTLAASGALVSYCLWAFDASGLSRQGDHLVWIELSVAPVFAAVLWMLRLLEAGGGGSPTELAWSDRMLQVLGLVWGLLVALGVYG